MGPVEPRARVSAFRRSMSGMSAVAGRAGFAVERMGVGAWPATDWVKR